jgi:hypothetical protein
MTMMLSIWFGGVIILMTSCFSLDGYNI